LGKEIRAVVELLDRIFFSKDWPETRRFAN
jgi:hypothetical protein